MAEEKKRKRRPRAKSPAKKEERSLTIKHILAKGRVLTGNVVEESAALQEIDAINNTFEELEAVEAPYEPESLLNYIKLSPHVTPCLEAMANNIEGYGWHLEPVESWMAKLDSPEAREAVAQALEIERWVTSEEAALEEAEKSLGKQEEEAPADDSGEPGSEEVDEEISEEEIDATLEEIRTQMMREQYIATAFFNNCCSEASFIKLKRITRMDYEAHGWSTMEMRRDGYGRLKRLSYVPAYTVRPLKDPGEFVDVLEPDPVTPLSKDREIQVKRRFRIYVQVVGGKKVYFKSPGDPRVVSQTTGKAYKDLEALRRPKDADKNPGEGKDAKEANELLWHAQHDPTTLCSPPRWIGNLLVLLGGREADETTYYYLHSNAIPPAILFVVGGKVPSDVKDRLESALDSELRGAENRHKILVVEAMPIGSSKDRTMLPQMKFESLRDAQLNDATFTNYDERAADRIGASFRLPPILRGWTPKNLNRATAFAAKALGEQQVFDPERNDGDWMYNKYILPEIGVRHHRFRSNSPPTTSVEDISDLVKNTAPFGGILPYQIQELVSEATNKPRPQIDEDWVTKPMPMTLAGLGGEGVGGEFGSEESIETMKRLHELEQRVATIVTEHLREAGMEMEVHASFVDDPDSLGSEGNNDGE